MLYDEHLIQGLRDTDKTLDQILIELQNILHEEEEDHPVERTS